MYIEIERDRKMRNSPKLFISGPENRVKFLNICNHGAQKTIAKKKKLQLRLNWSLEI
jgi:hypothetical protein